ncbi:hypothetical protein [Nocardia carnea]|uniref:hypothetical protein n=1 Tax=Nocardia carnea TaxID=37328 RepID=UPI002456D238|nr:hypothetical protein [Nocardia carnea]
MKSTARSPLIVSRIAGAVLGAAAVFAAAGGPAVAAPDNAPPGQLVVLNEYCEEPGAVAHVEDGRTVYCTQVEATDAFVWSYSPEPIPRDPNTREYTCAEDGCRYPDGSEVPGYQRCGILCGEPPTSGDVQSGLADCFDSGTPFEECERRLPE